MAKKADTTPYSPTDSDTTREAMFYPLFNDQYWTAAEKHLNETGDELFNLRSALDTTRSQFFDVADGVTADDVRRLELEVERAERQHEVAEEPVAWLKQRRDRDAESVRRSGMPSGLAKKKNRLRRIDEQIAYARSTERLQRLQNDRDLTARRVADLERRYNDAVRLLEDDIARQKISTAQGQAAADELAESKNAGIAAEKASLKEVTDRYDKHLQELNEERAELVAFLAEWDPAAARPTLTRR
ncbi:hypothetical protein ACFCZ3_14750 [Cellulosimicrobium cellulans]|uniref:hypothetical protein n=1 Tax=Cellulosimicrobium cellulans TaxID=1710 RepID=UPI0035D5FCA6